MFDFDSYIVLDIPSPVQENVMDIRKNCRDDFRIKLPVEITLAGSSGVGAISNDESFENVCKILDQIALETKPIEASFGDVLRFEGSDIFVFTLKNEIDFVNLHKRIANSGIKFEEIRHPYKPHCTLSSRSPITEDEANKIMQLKLKDTFILDTISIYVMDKLPMTRLYQIKLKG